MQVRTAGIVKSMELPLRFALAHEEAGSRGANWLRRYCPRGETSVEIISSYRGYPAVPVDNQHLREALKASPIMIFDEEGGVEERDAIRGMSLALGNVGNNQICNQSTGPGAAEFHLRSIVVENISGRPVVRVEGWFHDIHMKPEKYFCGIFIDATPLAENARVEELYLQTATKPEMEKYQSQFEQILQTIKWA